MMSSEHNTKFIFVKIEMSCAKWHFPVFLISFSNSTKLTIPYNRCRRRRQMRDIGNVHFVLSMHSALAIQFSLFEEFYSRVLFF